MKRFSMAVSALSLMSAPAFAQGTDTQIMQNVINDVAPTDGAGIRFVSNFASCAAASADQENRVKDIFKRLPGSTASDKDLFWIAIGSDKCAKSSEILRYSVRNLRGPIAEYALKRDFNLSNWAAKGTPSEIYAMPSNDELAKMTGESRNAVIYTKLGECIVTNTPASVGALLSADRGSAEEKAAFTTITPALTGCVPKGVEVRLSKFQLRGYLAEAAYRYAVQTPSKEVTR